MIPANDVDQLANSLIDVLEDHLVTDETPSALMALFRNEDGSLRMRVANATGSKWFRLSLEEFDPTKRPAGTPVRLLP